MKPLARNPLPDILKGLAVLLMIQVHLMELFAKQELMDSLAGNISLFLGGIPAAPVFMTTMGFFIAGSDKPQKALFIRGIRLLGLGLLLNTALNAHLLILILTGQSGLSPWPFVFGADILFLAGLSHWVIALLKPVFRRKALVWFLFAMLTAFITDLLPVQSHDQGPFAYFRAFVFGKGIHWSYFPLLPWAAYVLAGYALKLFLDKHREILTTKPRLTYLLAVISIMGIVAGWNYGFTISINLPLYYHHGLLFFLYALNFMLAWTWGVFLLSKNRPHLPLFQYLRYLGRHVTRFYIVQWILTGNLGTALYKTQSFQAFAGWFFLITLLSTLLVAAWNRIEKSGKPATGDE